MSRMDIDAAAPIEARERVLELLATSAPQRVMVDENLPAGTWIAVRAPEMNRERQNSPSSAAKQRDKV